MKHPIVIVIASIAVLAWAGMGRAAIAPADSAPDTESSGEPTTEASAATTHDGVWKPVTAVMSGVPLPAPVLKIITLKISGENYEVRVEGEEEADQGTCALDTSTTPKRMTIKSTAGPNRGKTMLAIYEMTDAQTLRVCYDLSGKDFPKEFQAPKDSLFYLVDYKRQKQ